MCGQQSQRQTLPHPQPSTTQVSSKSNFVENLPQPTLSTVGSSYCQSCRNYHHWSGDCVDSVRNTVTTRRCSRRTNQGTAMPVRSHRSTMFLSRRSSSNRTHCFRRTTNTVPIHPKRLVTKTPTGTMLPPRTVKCYFSSSS